MNFADSLINNFKALDTSSLRSSSGNKEELTAALEGLRSTEATHLQPIPEIMDNN